MNKEIIEWIKSIAIALILAFAITSFISGTKVYGSSMNPTLNHDDFLIILKSKDIKHGDIVIVKTDLEIKSEDLKGLDPISKWKMGKTKSLIKRVIALEGDSLAINNGEVFLNGEKLEENYIGDSSTLGDIIIKKIPGGKVFVMGDNRDNSLDSRSKEVGLVDMEDISGKVAFQIYPFSKLGKVR